MQTKKNEHLAVPVSILQTAKSAYAKLEAVDHAEWYSFRITIISTRADASDTGVATDDAAVVA